MEIRLDAADPQQMPPKDTFVALRIGDVQKQSRFTSSRTYRFPHPGDYRADFGRIEVFQRVGHVTVSFENVSKNEDIEVPCELGDLKSLKLRMGMNREGQKPVTPSTKQRTAKARLDAAQKYLVNHHLEEILADAMREVLHEKPSDPHSFLANQIMKHAAPKPVPISGMATTQANDETTDVEVLRMEARDALLRAAGDGSLEPALTDAKAESTDVEVLRMEARDALLRSAKDGSLANVLQAKTENQVSTEVSTQPTKPFALKASVGTWLAPAPEPEEPVASEPAVILSQPHEKLIELPKETLIAAYETELQRMDAEIARLRAKLGP